MDLDRERRAHVFHFPENARWDAERQAAEFGVEIGEYQGGGPGAAGPTDGASGVAPLAIALEVAEETGSPVMAHLDHLPPSRLEVLARLRRGDIPTHCFRPFPYAPVRPDGRMREEVLEARRRGVIFDIGHGSGSFGFRTAEATLTTGFPPDVISSDVHAQRQGAGVRSAGDDVEIPPPQNGADRCDPSEHSCPQQQR